MADFKLTIADPKTGKTYQTEAKDKAGQQFIGKNIGERVKGDDFGLSGYELEITGGSDYCGFPMRKGIMGLRKRIAILQGIGFRGGRRGMRKRKTVCGHKIHDKISQINLKVIVEGSRKLGEMFVKQKKEGDSIEEPKKDEKKPESKDAPMNEKQPKK